MGARRTPPHGSHGSADISHDADSYPQEVEVGNVEYKLKLVSPTPARFQQLVTQLAYRLAEGRGRAVYLLGVKDDGALHGLCPRDMCASLGTLRRMCGQVSARMVVAAQRTKGVPTGRIAEVRIEQFAECAQVEVRIAVLGSAQAGKSSVVGVLAGGPGALLGSIESSVALTSLRITPVQWWARRARRRQGVRADAGDAAHTRARDGRNLLHLTASARL